MKLEFKDMTDTEKKPKGAGKSSFELIDPNTLTETLPIKPGSVVLDLTCVTHEPPYTEPYVRW